MRTNGSVGLSRRFALMTGIVTGVLASSSACVFPDQCIVIVTNGYDWCSGTIGALMWPAGQPELAQPVLKDGKPPTGCRCFNTAEDEIMWAELPVETYTGFELDIQQAVRNECDFVVPAGWDHNCYDEGPDEIDFKDPYPQDGPGDCVGSCSYAGKDCGDPPNPYECEEEYGFGETGYTGETGEDPVGIGGVGGIERPIALPEGDV